MPKLFHKGEWFYEISPTALLESEFEDLLVQNAKLVRHDARIVKYKRTVYSDEGSAQADLAIIGQDYKEWIVVEVEMIRHSLHSHVIPQIRVLRSASYGAVDADYLATKDVNLDRHKLAEMMRGHAPEVLVLVNKLDKEWEKELRRYGVRQMVFEVFRSEMNRYIFSIDGEIPKLADDVVTYLTVDKLLPRFVVVASPAALAFKAGQRFEIFVDDQLTEWERIDIQTNCYIAPTGLMPLALGRKYALMKSESGQYSIRTVKS